jgi:hypothetical protein
MSLIRSLIGRRQFLIAFISSFTALAFGRFTKVFGLMFKEVVARASESTKPLKAVVVYYSAAGATDQYAGATHRGMKSVMECDVAPQKKMDPKEMAKYDVVAIGGPIWYFRETANLRLYIYRMPNMAGKLCIPFCSHGGLLPVSSIHSIRLCERRSSP